MAAGLDRIVMLLCGTTQAAFARIPRWPFEP
jgi:hypothetical protein